jgi:crossover junction endodeoxyribonuclease RuvC
MGFGVIEMTGSSFRLLDYGALSTTSSMSAPQRLLKVYEKVSELIETHHPDAMSVEELFFNTNVKTAIMVAQARGVVLALGAQKGVSLFEYTPIQVKQGVVGYGRADKNQVQQMVKVLLNLKEIPKPDDAADALAVAICHAHARNAQKLFEIK